MNDPAIQQRKNNPLLPGSKHIITIHEAQENTKMRRSQSAKHQFQNPEYRETVLARLRSPKFQAKARRARAKQFKKDPNIFKRRGNTLSDHKLDQLTQLLGGDPKEVLENLHLKQGQSQTDIAHRFRRHTTTVNHWFKRFGISTVHSISAKTTRKRHAGQLTQLL